MQLIPAPAGVLEVDALWQNDNPNDPNTDTVALLCHPNPLFDGTMNNNYRSGCSKKRSEARILAVRIIGRKYDLN